MNRNFWIVLGIIALVSGCIGGEPKPLPPEMQAQMAAQAEQDTPAPASAVTPPTGEPQPAPTEAAAVEQPPVREKGSGYGGDPITEPVSQYWGAKRKIEIDIPIQHTMNAFRAMNDRFPRDWDEFDREILKPAQIRLPELPAGKKYYYDPHQGQLMVETVQ